MVNCAHPTHFDGVLEDGPWLARIDGVRANASTMSHAELDAGDPDDLAAPATDLLRIVRWSLGGDGLGSARHISMEVHSMRVSLRTFVVMVTVAWGGSGDDDDKAASDEDSSGAETAAFDVVACLEVAGFKQGDLPVGATEAEGAENVGQFVIPDTKDDYLIVYETDSEAAAESAAAGYFGTGVNGAAAVGTRFYAYTSDTHPVQPDIDLCLAS
jgi:hypothetical protein